MDTELKNDYELSFLIKAPGDEARIFEVLKKYGVQVYHEGPIDNISLSYPIKKQTSALFGFCYFAAAPEDINKIKTELESLSSLLRFLLITPPVKPIERQSKTSEPPETKKDDSPRATSLTNEALEQKLEEILK